MGNTKGHMHEKQAMSYNRCLFESQACFNDIVWIIDLASETVDVLHDNLDPSAVGQTIPLDEIRAKIASFYPATRDTVSERFTVPALRAIAGTIGFDAPIFIREGVKYHMKLFMTPEFDENGNAIRIYLTALNIRNIATNRRAHTEIYRNVALILSRATSLEQGINDSLEHIGRALGVSRVYIFENEDDPDYASNTFEWCAEGVEPEVDMLKHMSYEVFGYRELFKDSRVFCCGDVSRLEDAKRELFERQGILSLVNYAFYDSGRLAGLIGVDDCEGTHPHWDPDSEEIEIFTVVADLLTTYLIKERNLKRASASEAEAQKQSLRSDEFLSMLESLVGSAPWYVYYNEDGTEKEANWSDNLRAMLGYEGEEDFPNTFATWANAIHPDDRADTIAACEKALDENGIFGKTYRAICKDGSIRLLKTQGTAKRYANGMPRLYYGTIHDVTEEETLRRNELEYKAMLRHFVTAYTSAYTVNLKDRTFEILHMAHDFETFFTMNGNLADMAHFVENHVHPDDRAMMRNMTDPDYIRARLVNEDRITFTEREQYAGTERVMHVIIMRGADPDNCAVGFMDVTSELQKQKEINEKLEAANVALRHEREQSKIIETLSTSFSSIYHVDMDSFAYKRVVEREPSVLFFPETGPYQENFAQYVEHFMMPEYRKSFEAMLRKDELRTVLADHERFTLEYCREDGSWRRGYFIPCEYNDDGDLMSFLFAVQNIADEKKRELEVHRALEEAYEAAQLANAAKTTFLSNMSHDIRTPMNAIIGMTAIAGAHLNEPDRIADCLKKINSSGRHLLGLINQVLDMSKIESGKVDLSEEDFNLSDLIDEVISMNHSAGKHKGHALYVRIEELEHEHVIGDRTRLEQVFNNLLSNAIKYTPDGGRIEIVLTEKQTNKPNIGWYEVVVSDNGIGMTEDYVKTIFEPFSRASDTRAAAMQGTGLGMPIARNIIRMMNGDITVESKPDRGSRFTAAFALRLQTDRCVDYDDFIDLPVLVVDDDEVFCESTCTILNDLSMQSEYVTSGPEAIDRTVARHEAGDDFYAIIMDWKMPGMDGVETTRRIRSRVGKDVPIIVLTSYDWTEIEEEAREAGVNAFLNKPLFKSKVIELFNDLNVRKINDTVRNAAESDEYDFTGKRILLAEDNELNREIAIELLGVTGVEIDTAENGSICVDMFTSKARGYYDLIFMDIQMPIMNGYDAARAIRASGHPDAEDVPIIAMTANAFTTDVRAAFDAGMNGHIAKPIDITAVLRTMAQNLR